jgi:glutathione-regulated potassium-efflux system protein KefB
MEEGGVGGQLLPVVILLGSAVVAVPIFRRLGLGSVLGYLAAGLVIGPFGLRFFQDPDTILHVAELGVVMLLFIIGLELRPSRLWSLRRDIFGLGLGQVVICGLLLYGGAVLAGLSPTVAFVAGSGLAMSSTAIVLQILNERGESTQPHGQRAFSILLFQDLAIVPLLAILAFLAPGTGEAAEGGGSWLAPLTAVAAVVAVVAAGRWLLNPFFRLLAESRAREIMTAAALLVVLGAALVMDMGGLSMAMGAFLAGVLLSESSFRHQLEAEIEPFRGILLGLFFLAVGMSIDLGVVARAWALILGAVVVFMALKIGGLYGVARLFRSSHGDSVRLAMLLSQGGEFAFVLFSTARDATLLTPELAAILTAAVIVSMALTPLAAMAIPYLVRDEPEPTDGLETAEGRMGTVLLIGFGRFGQVVSQILLARGIEVTIIDASPEMIRSAARFGFKIFYGDGTRLDVLRTAGAGSAKLIAVAVDKKETANRIVELAKAEFPLASLYVRSYDRAHTLELHAEGVAYEIRETFESAIRFGEASLRGLGATSEEAAAVAADIRRRDLERLEIQKVEGITGGRDRLIRQGPVPTPLTEPKREGRPLNEETAVVATPMDEPPASDEGVVDTLPPPEPERAAERSERVTPVS